MFEWAIHEPDPPAEDLVSERKHSAEMAALPVESESESKRARAPASDEVLRTPSLAAELLSNLSFAQLRPARTAAASLATVVDSTELQAAREAVGTDTTLVFLSVDNTSVYPETDLSAVENTFILVPSPTQPVWKAVLRLEALTKLQPQAPYDVAMGW